MLRLLLPIALLAGCNTDPSDEQTQTVGYRTGTDGGANSGERGSVKITEILWSGSVRNLDGGGRRWDPTDIFIEIRNEGDRPMNLSGWQLWVEGTAERTYILPDTDVTIDVGGHVFVATQTRENATGEQNGCFLGATWLIPDLELPYGDPFRITLRDRDERLIEPAGDKYMPPFAGGYDLHTSRSMEKVELMFGGRGNEPQSWHHYTKQLPRGIDPSSILPNTDFVHPDCQERTHASPGLPNSVDYSGAFSTGALD
ncbi:MAG: lamin tail domain-containing protein [Deltaproteobacteria bacterium]|nr:MAG: lamin tail domain-containing protein [Deltaproteobacteria bacterium]